MQKIKSQEGANTFSHHCIYIYTVYIYNFFFFFFFFNPTDRFTTQDPYSSAGIVFSLITYI